MKHFKREIEPTEIEVFTKKFLGSGKRYGIESNALGVITSIETDDKEILAYAKKLGLKQDD